MIFFKLNGDGQLANDIKFMNQVQASWEKKELEEKKKDKL